MERSMHGPTLGAERFSASVESGGLRFPEKLFYREAGAGIEPAVELLQSSALPLGDPAATGS